MNRDRGHRNRNRNYLNVRPHRLACPSCGGVVAKIILNRNINRNSSVGLKT